MRERRVEARPKRKAKKDQRYARPIPNKHAEAGMGPARARASHEAEAGDGCDSVQPPPPRQRLQLRLHQHQHQHQNQQEKERPQKEEAAGSSVAARAGEFVKINRVCEEEVCEVARCCSLPYRSIALAMNCLHL